MTFRMLDERARDLGEKIGWALCALVNKESTVAGYIWHVNDVADKAGLARRATLPEPTAISSHQLWSEALVFAAFRTLSYSLIEQSAAVTAALKGTPPTKDIAETIGGEILDVMWMALASPDSSFPQGPYQPDKPGVAPSCIEEEFVWSRSSEYLEMTEQEALLVYAERMAHLVAGFGRLHRKAQGCALILAAALSVHANKAVLDGISAFGNE